MVYALENSTFLMLVLVSTFLAPQRPVDIDADVVFLMDSSQQVTKDSFTGQKRLVKHLTRLLSIYPGNELYISCMYLAIYEEFKIVENCRIDK